MTIEPCFDSIEFMDATQPTFDHSLQKNTMGEARKDALRLNFDRRLKLEFHGAKVTSDGGLLAYRELDGALGLTSTVDSELSDIRTGKNTQHSLTALLRQSIYIADLQVTTIRMTQALCREILARIQRLRFLTIPARPG